MNRYGYRRYIDKNEFNDNVKEYVINEAIDEIQRTHNVEIDKDSCETWFDDFDTKTIYNNDKVHYFIGIHAYDKDGNYLGCKDAEIYVKSFLTAFKITMEERKKHRKYRVVENDKIDYSNPFSTVTIEPYWE